MLLLAQSYKTPPHAGGLTWLKNPLNSSGGAHDGLFVSTHGEANPSASHTVFNGVAQNVAAQAKSRTNHFGNDLMAGRTALDLCQGLRFGHHHSGHIQSPSHCA